ncbi:hypothetical protein B2J96_12290 [Mycobacterium shigaense]|nr:hypothetical protein B2J96_12290 [Mycobacterium shigaense]
MKKFNDVLEGALKAKGTGSFTAKDDTETVEVVTNGDMCITQVCIEDGLLRLGADKVEDRINEALSRAQAKATAANEAMYGATFEALAGIVQSMAQIVGE